MGLSACATSNLPPELRDPTAHIRPVETGDFAEPTVFEDTLATGGTGQDADIAEDCEAQRLRAATDSAALAAFARCSIASGEVERAWWALEGHDLPERELAGLLTGRIAASETRLNSLLEAHPDQPALWNLLGREYERQDRPAEAVDAFLRAESLRARNSVPEAPGFG